MHPKFGTKIILISFLTSLLLQPLSYAAETIELPEEELATESVLPVFDKTVAVRNRLVETAGKVEVGGGLGFNLIEGLYTNTAFKGNFAYHFSEEKAVSFSLITGSSELSSTGKDLKAGKGIQTSFDASLAPTPDFFITGNYQYTAYYGKVSVSKTRAMNIALYGLAGGGLVSWSDGEMSPMLNAGIGQKFYFSPRFALRADLEMKIYQGPDITSEPLLTGSSKLKSSDFSDETYFRPFLTVGFVFLL
jgi:outer membrane beta-barrel protein